MPNKALNSDYLSRCAPSVAAHLCVSSHGAPMKIVTLNIRHGGGTRANRLLDSLAAFAADVLILTEYGENSNSALFRSRLFELGYSGRPRAP